MKKIILCLLLTPIALYACYGCVDMGSVQIRGQLATTYFKKLDAETAQKIQEINRDITRAHKRLEEDNKVTIENIERLDREYLLLTQEATFNQQVINKLNGIISSTIGEKLQLENTKESIKNIQEIVK